MPILWLELWRKLTVRLSGEERRFRDIATWTRWLICNPRLIFNWRMSAAMPFMNTEEYQIYEYLKQCPHRHVPIDEILHGASPAREFSSDRNWIQAILRRMTIEGWIETNARGDYRLKPRPEETTSFKKALESPGAPLGDTTIITLQDVTENQPETA